MATTLKHYRYWCTLQLENIFEWRDDAEGDPPDCRYDQAPIDNIVIIEEQPAPDPATHNLPLKNGVLVITRGIIGGQVVPTSAAIVDAYGRNFEGINVLAPGAALIDVHLSRNSDDPANQAEIDAAILAGEVPPAPDYSNIDFDIYLGQQYVSVGPNYLDKALLGGAHQGRYIQIEAVRGTITNIETY